MADSKSSDAGIGFTGLLQLLFIGLKLADVIDWSWWWVLAPTWISLGIVILVVIAVFIVSAVSVSKTPEIKL